MISLPTRPARQHKHRAQASEPLAARRSPQHPPRRATSGFTLVELLIVILIIGILASMVLGALYASQEKSKVRFTRSTIAKINNQIAQRWDSFRTRRVQLNPSLNTTAASAAQIAQWQLLARWELIRMELPDHYGDLNVFAPQYSTPSGTALWNAYKMQVNWSSNPAPDQSNISSELLYLIITVGMNPDDELQFMEREIGDTDKDGMLEFLDGWGRPIRFIRWAPGFNSELQPRDITRSPDPFDHLGINRPGSRNPAKLPTPRGLNTNNDPWGFALQPLIYSAGPDGAFGLFQDRQDNFNPYAKVKRGGTWYWLGQVRSLATDEGGGSLDNVHNHLLGGR